MQHITKKRNFIFKSKVMKHLCITVIIMLFGLNLAEAQIKRTAITEMKGSQLHDSPASHGDLSDFVISTSVLGYMKIDDIEGESQDSEHRNEIELYGISWNSSRQQSSVGSGRNRGEINHSPIRITKSIDKASPYIMEANWKGKAIDQVEITLVSNNDNFEYMTIVLENVMISSYLTRQGELPGKGFEFIGLSFEQIRVLYKSQNDDGSEGDEHEVEYDVVAGV